MSRFAVIDPAQLGRMIVLDTLDSEQTIVDRMLKLKELWASYDPPAKAEYDVENLEFDPLKIQAELATYFETLLRDRVNQAARSVTLAFAIDTDLEAIASRYPGGVPRISGESDERYKRRVWLSPNALSPHGNAEAYVFFALTADDKLRDATAVNVKQGTGKIQVTVLNEDISNPRPTNAQLTAVRIYIYDFARKGLTDIVSVMAPELISTKYRLRYWLFPGRNQTTAQAEMLTALNALIEEQRWLGYDHTLAAIDKAAMVAGVQNVEILEPVRDLACSPLQFVDVAGVELTYMGRNE